MTRIGRRRCIATLGCAGGVVVRLHAQLSGPTETLSKAERDRMTPAQVIDELKKGNERFRSGTSTRQDYRKQQQASADAQYPAAVILGCIDSRAPAEIIFDVGIGDTFNARIAGNIVDDDLLGSLEFACSVAGAKAVLVLGHTACGAIKGAIDHVTLGNLTGLLAHIQPAVAATEFTGQRSSKNAAYVDAVARTNVSHSIEVLRRRSVLLADLEKEGKIQIAGAMYDLSTGIVDFVDANGSSRRHTASPSHPHR
jgi:carbonic anhydrase